MILALQRTFQRKILALAATATLLVTASSCKTSTESVDGTPKPATSRAGALGSGPAVTVDAQGVTQQLGVPWPDADVVAQATQIVGFGSPQILRTPDGTLEIWWSIAGCPLLQGREKIDYVLDKSMVKLLWANAKAFAANHPDVPAIRLVYYEEQEIRDKYGNPVGHSKTPIASVAATSATVAKANSEYVKQKYDEVTLNCSCPACRMPKGCCYAFLDWGKSVVEEVWQK